MTASPPTMRTRAVRYVMAALMLSAVIVGVLLVAMSTQPGEPTELHPERRGLVDLLVSRGVIEVACLSWVAVQRVDPVAVDDDVQRLVGHGVASPSIASMAWRAPRAAVPM